MQLPTQIWQQYARHLHQGALYRNYRGVKNICIEPLACITKETWGFWRWAFSCCGAATALPNRPCGFCSHCCNDVSVCCVELLGCGYSTCRLGPMPPPQTQRCSRVLERGSSTCTRHPGSITDTFTLSELPDPGCFCPSICTWNVPPLTPPLGARGRLLMPRSQLVQKMLAWHTSLMPRSRSFGTLRGGSRPILSTTLRNAKRQSNPFLGGRWASTESAFVGLGRHSARTRVVGTPPPKGWSR
jgi:hypothetical protein